MALPALLAFFLCAWPLAGGAGVAPRAQATPAESDSAGADTATWRPAEPRPAATDTIPAHADTTLEGFLGELSDSTDRYFGMSAAPGDTAGGDSALAWALENPRPDRGRGLGLSIWPDFAFNRVDGAVWSGQIRIGRPNQLGQLVGVVGYAAGPNDWLGGGGLRKTRRFGNAIYSLDLFAGRQTANMDHDRKDRYLSSARALIAGKDYRRYFRQDGFTARLERESETWRVGLGYRDMLESPLATTTTWNFARSTPVVIDNLPAAFGRAREVEGYVGWRLPLLPVIAEVTHQASGAAIGSDFGYRRTRFAMSGNFGLGELASLVPQVAYGRLTRSLLPQEAFYLGGSHSLRSLPGAARGGSGLALARLDVIGVTDILAWAHIPHPDALPIQAGLFGATGAVWGPDPYGGPTVPGKNWPKRRSWMSEVGASLIYQPGFPDPTGMIRLDYAEPLGPGRESKRWTFSYTRALDLVRPIGE